MSTTTPVSALALRLLGTLKAATGTSRPGSDGKGIDPVAVATLVLSIPPAALSVLDLADRISHD